MIQTSRLQLIPASIELLTAELNGRAAFERRLGITVPETWPPDLYERAAIEYTLTLLTENPSQPDWWSYYIVLATKENPVVAGIAGYKGPPDAEGTVEIGYSVLAEFQRQGIATEATRGLLQKAFAYPAVKKVLAETLPELAPSIGVLEKCGFTFIGEGSEEGVIRYALTRAAFEQIENP